MTSLACSIDLLDIEVDRHGMAELQQIGEAETGCGSRARRACAAARQASSVSAADKKNDVTGRLTQVDRLTRIFGRSGLGIEQMHGSC